LYSLTVFLTLPTLARKKKVTKTRILFLLLAVNLRHSDIFRKNMTSLGGSRAEIITNAAVRRFGFSICKKLFFPNFSSMVCHEIVAGFIDWIQEEQ